MIRIIFCIPCVRVFVFFLLLLLSVYFSFFQCSWFSVSSSVFFFPMLHLLFLPFILLILLLICLKPHLQKSAFHPYETVRTSSMGHILNQLYFTSAWLLVTLSKTVNSLVEKPLLSVVYFGRRPHESGEKKWGFKNVKIRVDMAFRPR